MTVRTFALTLCLTALVTGTALAQPPAAAPVAPRPSTQRPATPSVAPIPVPIPTPAPAPRREGQPVNVKVELTIADKRSTGAEALRKTVTVVTGDSMIGYIRSTAVYSNIGDVPLNVDVEPQIIGDGSKVRLRVNVMYELPAMLASGAVGTDPTNLRKTQIHENLTLILENGKPIVAAQSADPVGDRQVTVEVKATVMR